MKLYSAEELGQIFGIARDTVKKLARAGEITGLQLGSSNTWRFTQEDVDTFLDKQRKKPLATRKTKVKAESTTTPPTMATEPMISTEPLENHVPTTPSECDARIIELKKQGIIIKDMAVTLNDEGFKTVNGNQWSEGNLKKYARNLMKRQESADE